MISRNLVNMIRSNTDKLGEKWMRAVKESERMKAYQKLSDEELKKRNRVFFENLVGWIDEGAASDDIKSYFARIGRERYNERIPLDEINFAIIIAKKVLWNFILSEGFFSNALAIYQALEMLTVMYNFFDLGSFYIGKEYQEEMYEKIKTSGKFSEEELDEYIFPGKHITKKELEDLFGIHTFS
ncbi:MAG: hypothetical protein GY868_08370 [Deltaproteobacteria bacterium]|nr:hypothetical protein [Deltaproteobacteria bacterium]